MRRLCIWSHDNNKKRKNRSKAVRYTCMYGERGGEALKERALPVGGEREPKWRTKFINKSVKHKSVARFAGVATCKSNGKISRNLSACLSICLPACLPAYLAQPPQTKSSSEMSRWLDASPKLRGGRRSFRGWQHVRVSRVRTALGSESGSRGGSNCTRRARKVVQFRSSVRWLR